MCVPMAAIHNIFYSLFFLEKGKSAEKMGEKTLNHESKPNETKTNRPPAPPSLGFIENLFSYADMNGK